MSENHFIDTHAHIYLDKFKDDRNEMIERSVNAGVSKILMPNIDSLTVDSMLEMENDFPEVCIPMMGLHPGSVDDNFEKELESVTGWFQKRKFIAIGEIGTDLFWDQYKTYWEEQKEAFIYQIKLAKELKLPIVIHCRETLPQTIKMVEAEKDKDLTGVFHCFTGNIEEAKKISSLEFYFGIGGIVTFKNGGLDKVLPYIDPERIILETDSPFLTPVPHRGKRNEPSYIPKIAGKVADIYGFSIEKVADITTRNAEKLFKL